MSALVGCLFLAPLLMACGPEADTASEAGPSLRALADSEGFVVETQLTSFGGWEGLCVVYVLDDHGWTGLTVERNLDDGPAEQCGPLQPYLDRMDLIVGWGPEALTPIADQGLVQTLSETYDQPTGRQVDYAWVWGSLSADFWGTIYGEVEQSSVAGLGEVCARYLETDEGTPFGLLEPEDAGGACPILDTLPNYATVRAPLEGLTELTDAGVIQALDATFFGSAEARYLLLSEAPTQL